MKRLFNIFLISVIILTINVVGVFAKTITPNDLSPKIRSYILDHYKTLYDGKIEVECGRMSGMPLKLPDGNLQIKIKSNLRDDFVQRTMVRVSFYIDDNYKRSIGVPVTLSLYENVWVATQPIYRDEAISSFNVLSERRDISRIAATAARTSNPLNNARVKKTFTAGQILDHRFIKRNPDVLRNSLVSITFKSNKVNITITGQAMENGSLGDFIRVRSKEFKKDYMGKVINKGMVIVNI